VNLASVIDELVEERGLDREVLSSIVCESMLAAYSKRYPDLALNVEYDRQTGDILVTVKKTVVSTVSDEDREISLKKARANDKKLELGSEVWLPFDGEIGRIEILRAKQVIANSIRKIEADAIYGEFKHREGSIVVGVVHKCERGGAVVKVDDVLAFLPKSLSIPGEKCSPGFSIRVLLREVLPEPQNDSQLILDRASADFLEQLLKIEIPEIFEKLVEIKGVARIAGYKSKIIVASHDKNIDPVGTCVGVGGGRIMPIRKELGGEKIDVIPWDDSRELLIQNALKPARINSVEIVDGGTKALVWLDDDQRSLAIGKMGQNIALASKLVGMDIQIVSQAVDGEVALANALRAGAERSGDDGAE
jgi:transcription termination/antitermination protein NusA